MPDSNFVQVKVTDLDTLSEVILSEDQFRTSGLVHYSLLTIEPDRWMVHRRRLGRPWRRVF